MSNIVELLGDKAEYLLGFNTPKISKERLHLPGPDLVDRMFINSDRNNRVLGNLAWMYSHGRLGGTGYLSILPVDQGIEHIGGASFAKNPDYFDPENIVKLAIEGGCNAVASTFGVLGIVARKYAHKIPFMVKINHNELLTYPNKLDRSCSARSSRRATWARPRSARRSTSARRKAPARSSKSRRRLRWRTNSAWRRCCGATCATTPSRSRRRTSTIITSPRT